MDWIIWLTGHVAWSSHLCVVHFVICLEVHKNKTVGETQLSNERTRCSYTHAASIPRYEKSHRETERDPHALWSAHRGTSARIMLVCSHIPPPPAYTSELWWSLSLTCLIYLGNLVPCSHLLLCCLRLTSICFIPRRYLVACEQYHNRDTMFI
jgi:hypothetical protein